MRKPKIRELGEAIKALFSPAATWKFPAKEPDYISDIFRGKPEYNEDECIACGACAEVCPTGAISVIDKLDTNPPVRIMEQRWDECIFCGQCELNCTTEKGIHLTQEYDLACFNRKECKQQVEKELIICETCGEIIGAKEHILWVAKKLGPKKYTNLNLMLVSEQEATLSEKAPEKTGSANSVNRKDRVKVLCPKCRRAVILREAWG